MYGDRFALAARVIAGGECYAAAGSYRAVTGVPHYLVIQSTQEMPFLHQKSSLASCMLLGLAMALRPYPARAQEPESELFKRLSAITVNGIDHYNIDGIEINTQQLKSSFKKNTVRGHFTMFPIGSHNLNQSDSAVGRRNFVVRDNKSDKEGYRGTVTTYFVQVSDTLVRAIRFATTNIPDPAFERKFIAILIDGTIPKQLYTPLQADSFDFAGRRIAKDRSCRWFSINNINCSPNGQMNWSLHKSLNGAQDAIDDQYGDVVRSNRVKPDTVNMVELIFEGVPVTAKRVVYSVKGLNGLMTRAVGAKTLTTYYIAAEVRGRYVHCVLSHWNNDVLGGSGLPRLLEEVMRFPPK